MNKETQKAAAEYADERFERDPDTQIETTPFIQNNLVYLAFIEGVKWGRQNKEGGVTLQVNPSDVIIPK